MFEIEKNVPPPKPRASKRLYPWNDMEVGDSFCVGFPSEEDARIRRPKLSAQASAALGPGNYQTAIEGNGVRIWRTA